MKTPSKSNPHYVFSVTKTVSTTVRVEAVDVETARAKAVAAASKISDQRWADALACAEPEIEFEERET